MLSPRARFVELEAVEMQVTRVDGDQLQLNLTFAPHLICKHCCYNNLFLVLDVINGETIAVIILLKLNGTCMCMMIWQAGVEALVSARLPEDLTFP